VRVDVAEGVEQGLGRVAVADALGAATQHAAVIWILNMNETGCWTGN
jgi:hypothetical protein